MELSVQFHAPTSLSPGKDPGTRWMGDWVGRRVGVDVWRREETLALTRIWTLQRPTRTLGAISTARFQLPILVKLSDMKCKENIISWNVVELLHDDKRTVIWRS